jgi:hypothetical protein
MVLAAALTSSAPAGENTLTGKVMCGYQGWFSAEGDGMWMRWQHYGFGKPGECHIDLWPDVSELGKDELYDTPLRFADGRTAQVFSSAHPKTVERHFEWMRGYGIDGAFLQRFGASLKNLKGRGFNDRVLENVRAGAAKAGRQWAVMYDLSGLRADEIEKVVMQDWKKLRNEKRIIDDPAYLRHNGKPVVAVWGIGFNDNRDYTLDECAALLRFLRNNPDFGGMTVMAGVPFGWRTLDRDAANDPRLHEALQFADVISPWAVGRYGTVKEAERDIGKVHEADAAWCKERKKDYLPVVFPGFSWRNLTVARGGDAKLNAIPRLGGQFLWSQAMQRIQRGADMLYVAMFDELDEGTAIFKCADEVPVGPMGFVTNDGLPSDHYLWLTGQIGKVLRKELPAGEMPSRPKQKATR